LPESQVRAEMHKRAKFYDVQIQQKQLEINKLQGRIHRLNYEKRLLKNEKQKIQAYGSVSTNSEKRKFMHKCPNEDCRGFLSTGYKCKLCDTKVCSKCLAIKDMGATVEHECNPDDVKTTDAIKKETRPCPKCAVRIFKISGCDQMWCTQCNIAFSWKSGREVGGTVHNPHYYEWMRKQNLSGIRNPGEIVCGGIPNFRHLSVAMLVYSTYISKEYSALISQYHRGVSHIHYAVLGPLRTGINNVIDNSDIRVRYLMNEIDDKSFASTISRRDNIRQKNIAMVRLFEMYNTVLIERFNTFLALCGEYPIRSKSFPEWSPAHQKALEDLIETPKNIRKYCNDELKKISINYNMKVYIITPDFATRTNMVKYNSKNKTFT
jgi:hypothetical protein